ncbi:hypothetical protein HAX54_016302 [Datura stramonium]|uniref:Uncharacterized protein n=1 Tax=Datura stramonium TaxID=4076 RepID=A0ABS8UIK9_DATST|nr:hypothetical protein [Datura stramonium]
MDEIIGNLHTYELKKIDKVVEEPKKEHNIILKVDSQSDDEEMEHDIGPNQYSPKKVSALAQTEGTIIETDSLNVITGSRQELENLGGKIPETVNLSPIAMASTSSPHALPTVGRSPPLFSSPHVPQYPTPQENSSLIAPISVLPPPIEGELDQFVVSPSASSSMETSPTSLSPERGSKGSPSPTSPVPDYLATLIADSLSRYTSQESIQRSLPPTCSIPAGSDFVSATSDHTLTTSS